MDRRRVLILGAAGGFGKVFTSLLSTEGFEVRGVDTQPPDPATQGRLAGFVRADASEGSRDVLAEAEAADWVIACLPQEATFEAFRKLNPHMRPGSLFMDILSVKAPISRLMKSGRADVECLSLHPMFAPAMGFRNQNVVAVRIHEGRHGGTVESLLAKWGAHVHHLGPEQHDRTTAAVQVATHAAILAFGLALKAMEYNVSEALPISSPPHRTLLALLARIVNGKPEVYRQIQVENPLASKTRSDLIAAASDLQRLIEEGTSEELSQTLGSLRDMLGEANDPLSELAAQALALPLPKRE
jgi:4-amino-4-deoxyprephenate dehydrogenase